MDNRIDSVVRKYAQVIQEQYSPKEIYLYGSYAKGTANERSDIDIAVIIEPTNVNKYMDVFGKLFSLAANIDGRIEPNLIIDDGELDKYSLLHEIKTTGELVF